MYICPPPAPSQAWFTFIAVVFFLLPALGLAAYLVLRPKPKSAKSAQKTAAEELAAVEAQIAAENETIAGDQTAAEDQASAEESQARDRPPKDPGG